MKPGIHADVPESQYHADPALSQSQLKVLLDCPARFAWERTQPPRTSDAFDLGSAVHAMVLGVGASFVALDFDSWRTKAAQAERDAVREEGKVPLLVADAQRVATMTEAVLAHPGARPLFEAEGGVELSMWWQRDGVDLRGRVDKATEWGDGTPLLVDLKTSASAAPHRFAKSVYDFGYTVQDAVYRDGWERVTGARPDFLFVVVEKEPPHFVAVYRLDATAQSAGERDYLHALSLYRQCVEADAWPAYGDDITELPSPRWAA